MPNGGGNVDYDALAKQYGATSSGAQPASGIDYDALAKQAGATSSVQAQSGGGVDAPPMQYDRAMMPVWGEPRVQFTDVPKDEKKEFEKAVQQGYAQGGKMGLTAVGSTVAPELLPEMEGGGFLGYMARVFARSGAAGLGASAGTSTGQALTPGQSPFSLENLKESAETGAGTALLAGPFEALGELPSTKIGRGAINLSVGAQARDVTYGNPAKALLDEGIGNLSTGDIEAYKDVLRQTKDPAAAAHAAGGRFAAVSQRINELAPQVNQALRGSSARIPVYDAIEKPLDDAAFSIVTNRAMTDPEKSAALTKLMDLRTALTRGLGPDASPIELQGVKQQVGNRINWGGATAVGDEVKPAYQELYTNLKNIIHQAVPQSAPLDERLSNLLAAQTDLKRLAGVEEVGRGSGVMGGKIGTTILGTVQSGAGRVLPAVPASTAPTRGVIGSLVSSVIQDQKDQNTPSK